MQNNREIEAIFIEVLEEYQALRTLGKSRDDAIREIRYRYSKELCDDDDRVAILCGLSLALCRKKELTNIAVQETVQEIDRVLSQNDLGADIMQFYKKVKQLLLDSPKKGDEAKYLRRHPYAPDWTIGDLFVHRLHCPKATDLGLAGWSVLFYKAGEYTGHTGRKTHLMYVLICPPGKEPHNNEQLNSLGFLRMMKHDGKWDYMSQISPRSKKDELGYELTKIGNFSDLRLPIDRTDENPLVARPLFGYLRKEDTFPCFEEDICRMYQNNGVYTR